MRRPYRAALALLGVFVCCDEQEPAWRLDRARILGAAVSVDGDPTRSSFVAGETVNVELITASAAKERGAFDGWAFTACITDDDVSLARCDGPRLLAVSGQGPGDPIVALSAPPGVLGKVIVFGVMCEGGAARLHDDQLRGECDGAHGQEVVVRLEVGGTNRRPEIGDDGIQLDDRVLPVDGRCETTPFLVRADGTEHTFQIRASALETDDRPLLSHVATDGALARLYSSPTADRFSVRWTAPDSLTVSRKSARFHFILRDGRGGVAFTQRTVCLERGN